MSSLKQVFLNRGQNLEKIPEEKFICYHRKKGFLFLRFSIFPIINYSINFGSCDVMLNISTQVRLHCSMHLSNCK